MVQGLRVEGLRFRVQARYQKTPWDSRELIPRNAGWFLQQLLPGYLGFI